MEVTGTVFDSLDTAGKRAEALKMVERVLDHLVEMPIPREPAVWEVEFIQRALTFVRDGMYAAAFNLVVKSCAPFQELSPEFANAEVSRVGTRERLLGELKNLRGSTRASV